MSTSRNTLQPMQNLPSLNTSAKRLSNLSTASRSPYWYSYLPHRSHNDLPFGPVNVGATRSNKARASVDRGYGAHRGRVVGMSNVLFSSLIEMRNARYLSTNSISPANKFSPFSNIRVATSVAFVQWYSRRAAKGEQHSLSSVYLLHALMMMTTKRGKHRLSTQMITPHPKGRTAIAHHARTV